MPTELSFDFEPIEETIEKSAVLFLSHNPELAKLS